LGKFEQVWDMVFCVGQSVVHLANYPVTDGGGGVHTGTNYADMFMKPTLLEKLQWCLDSLGLQKR